MSDAEIKKAITELQSGSVRAVVDLGDIAHKASCTADQFHLITSAIFAVLDDAHLRNSKEQDHTDQSRCPVLQAMSLDCLSSIIPRWVARGGHATLRAFMLRWSALHAWVIYLKNSYVDQESIDLAFRLAVKRSLANFLGLCHIQFLRGSFETVITSPGIISTMFSLWRLETNDQRFNPSQDNTTPPPIFEIPATLDAWMCTFAHQEKWNWAEILQPFHGEGHVLATTALDHLQLALARTPINYDLVIWDIHLITTLSIHDAIRIPLLNQRSVAILTSVISIMLSQTPLQNQRPLVSKCLSYTYWYIRAYVESTDGIPWIIQAVEAGLLPAILYTEPWMQYLESVDDEDWEPLLLLLGQIIPKYSMFRSVVRPIIESLKMIDAAELPAKLRRDSELFHSWSMFEKVVRNRAGLYALEVSNETHIESCQNPQCNKSGPSGSFKHCAGCFSVHYCSKECQTYDWKNGGHQKYCRDIQARRAGSMSRLSKRDLRFIDRVIAHDIRFFRDRIQYASMTLKLDPVVIELDYMNIPMQIGISSLGSLSTLETCQCDVSMAQKWNHMVDLAHKSTSKRLLVRAFIPSGASQKVKFQCLPLKWILGESDLIMDEEQLSMFDDTFDHLYSCAGLSFGIIDEAFPEEAMRSINEKARKGDSLDALD